MLLTPFLHLLVLLSLSIIIQPCYAQSFIFNGFKSNPTNLTLNCGANITENGILHLTNFTARSIGRGFYSDPIRFKNPNTNNSLSFSTAFVFSITPRYKKLGGHGLAFTISPTKDMIGAQPSEFLGLFNVSSNKNISNHIFAVEFDTVKDFDVWDINDNHVGVDVNRMRSINSTRAGYFIDGNSTKNELCLTSGRKIQAWIDYDGEKHEINVTLSVFSKKPITPIISIPLDLSEVFQDFMYVGFSASTGRIVSNHYIYGWTFNMSGKSESLDLDHLATLQTFYKTDDKVDDKGDDRGDKVLVIKFLGSLLLVLLAALVIIVGRVYVKKFKNIDVVDDWEIDVGPHTFCYKELKDATKSFHDKGLLGFGGSGKVYKGVLPDSGSEIAVKRISRDSKQGPKEFVSEISTVGRLRHRNLVQLLGWCRWKGEFFLVYDFMANGSLEKYIHNNAKMILSWEQRFKIINGVSNGLVYLHEGWEQTVLHRDIKAGNVLLDSEWNGRLGDFGLAKLYDHGSNATTTKVVGTLGYLAPELTRTGKPTTSSDVYAFGALLLEVVCGRKPIEMKASPEELILVDWVWDKLHEGALLKVVDSRLNGKFDEVEVTMVLKLGLMCSNDEPSLRPTMRQVITYLEGKVPLPKVFAPSCDGSEKSGFVVKFDDDAPLLEIVKI
ncbi:hypothetical protein CTI12_AA285630 [Artemisia annua]|uniref:non-specific serine/threonine protein kinase n=1 Tax=Artemisia annua TaxID=35608 RepID=A0A2U1NBN9_ARTAN|nr:hypothetical protein CTI12_AA285630 [Artemisia annua]